MTARVSRSIAITFACFASLTAGAIMTAQRASTPGQRSGGAAPTGRAQSSGAESRRSAAGAEAGGPIRVLFLGMDEERPHNPARMFPHLAAPLARRGIQVTYVADQAAALDPDKL